MDFRIASFNLHNFSLNSAYHRDIDTIAKILNTEKIDVVAFQEVFSEGKGLDYLLDTLAKYVWGKWKYCYEVPKASIEIQKMSNYSRSDGYAFLWNEKRLKLVEYSSLGQKKEFEPRIINSLSNDVNTNCEIMVRKPYYIRLQPMYGGFFEFRLLNVHLLWGDNSLSSIIKRKVEFSLLSQEIYTDISSKRYGNFRPPYTIAMGDYNLNIFTPFNSVQLQDKKAILDPIYTYKNGNSMIHVITDQTQLSTLKTKEDGYANNYDHFTYSKELSPFSGIRIERIDAINKYCKGDQSYYREKISDHLPIVMTVTV